VPSQAGRGTQIARFGAPADLHTSIAVRDALAITVVIAGEEYFRRTVIPNKKWTVAVSFPGTVPGGQPPRQCSSGTTELRDLVCCPPGGCFGCGYVRRHEPG
jgi:hypothetical protein